MKEFHTPYDHTLDEYTKNQIKYAFDDVFDEIDDIRERLKNDPHSELIIEWVRYAISNVLKDYTE
jgi:hypothetical protein